VTRNELFDGHFPRRVLQLPHPNNQTDSLASVSGPFFFSRIEIDPATFAGRLRNRKSNYQFRCIEVGAQERFSSLTESAKKRHTGAQRKKGNDDQPKPREETRFLSRAPFRRWFIVRDTNSFRCRAVGCRGRSGFVYNA
jgi:hypothetical protein